jgi:dolichyl-phosphate-mannose-protein mannosyltransferase
MIEVVDDMIRGKRRNFENINILSTRFRLRNLNLGCYLRAANAILPQWGFKQVEVSCDKQNDPSDHHTYWNVEQHVNPRRK